MQTFLPYPDLRASCVVLDDRRLGKQRVETFQILRALTFETYAWRNHPAVRMWRGFVPALVRYGRENCREWMRRGYSDSLADKFLDWTDGLEPDDPPLPPWFGWEPVHRSHRLALLRKEPEWYVERFPVEAARLAEGDDEGYVWPPDVFPLWPVRGDGLAVPSAVRALGLTEARPAQAAAAEAVAAGRDVLLVLRPGAGASTAGLLAGLVTKGVTRWVHPPLLPRAGAVPAVVGPEPREVPAGDPAPLTARPPGPADRMAMRAEAAPPEFVFCSADRIPGDVASELTGPVGLVVVDRGDRLEPEQARALAGVRRRLEEPPLLVIAPRADPGRRDLLTATFELRDPVHAGGGWDPGSVLDVRAVGSGRARGSAVADLVGAGRPALVVCPTRTAADRRADRLTAEGLPAHVWAPPPMRPARAAAALAAFRSRRLAALVVAAEALPPLSRARLPLLISEDPQSLEAWRQEVEAARAERSVAVVSPAAAPDLIALARHPGCLRAALLHHFGEPLTEPCERCVTCENDPLHAFGDPSAG